VVTETWLARLDAIDCSQLQLHTAHLIMNLPPLASSLADKDCDEARE
jgi:hypothetical protein